MYVSTGVLVQVMALVFVGVLIFGILGVALFGGTFFSCNCSHVWPLGVTPMTHTMDYHGVARLGVAAEGSGSGSWDSAYSTLVHSDVFLQFRRSRLDVHL